MRFVDGDGVPFLRCGTATLISRQENGHYVIITAAQNFEDKDKNLKDAIFVLHRNGPQEYSAVFQIIKEKIKVHEKFDKSLQEDADNGVFYGHDIALAEIKFLKGNQDAIPQVFPVFPKLKKSDKSLVGNDLLLAGYPVKIAE